MKPGDPAPVGGSGAARVLWPALVSLVLAVPPVGAQEPPTPEPQASEPLEAVEVEDERANEVAVFLGGTAENGETFFTVGAEYERRFGPLFGGSLVVEHVSDLDAWVFLAPFSVRPIRGLGLKVYAGPGVESKVPRSAEEPGRERARPWSALPAPGPEGGRETFFLVRAGVGWALEWNRLSFTPQVEFDFTREDERWEHAVVFGVAIGFGF